MHKDIPSIIENMTLHEKIGMIHAKALFKNGSVDRLNIPELVMSDGTSGVRFDHKDDAWMKTNEPLCYVSWLPSGTAIASTWNKNIAYNAGAVLGREARGRGKDIILSPGVNIQRTPLCGRNFEYMSEDPYLTGIMASFEIRGIQEQDVAACVKHFALNNQEKERLSIDVNVSDRALYEIYIPAFDAAVKLGGSYTIMCAYNKVRGSFASENKMLLVDILRDEWNYDGVILSDWGSVHSTTNCALHGVDVEMGVTYDFDDYFFAKKLEEEVEAGNVPEELINERVRRILELQNKLKIGEVRRKQGMYNSPQHQSLLHEAARESIVLLKNEDNVLPLNTVGKNSSHNSIIASENIVPHPVPSKRKIAVIGDAATRKIAQGGGSSEIKPLYEITPLLGINMISGGDTEVLYCDGYYVDNAEYTAGEVNWQATSLDADTQDIIEATSGTSGTTGTAIASEATCTSSSQRAAKLGPKAKELLDEAVKLAAECDEVIYVGGLNRAYDTEGFDRTSYKLPYNQDVVINALLDVNPNTVIYILSGSAVDMSSFADRAKAILWSSMNGMTGGLALAEIIFGHTNPSGKLPSTFGTDIGDYSSHSIGLYPGTYDEDGNPHCSYDEGIFVGYRHFTTRGIKPLFEFGHGLSYTTFEYSDLKMSTEADTTQGVEDIGNVPDVKDIGNASSDNEDGLKGVDKFELEFTVKNTGDMAGSEVAMLFVSPVGSEIERPVTELKKFTKVKLEPNEERKVRLCVTPSSFAYFDEDMHCYRALKGSYIINIGSSVSDIRLSCEVKLSEDHIVDSLIDSLG